ncbi:MAG: TAT-variant-translocated molybdopterin oxidoreductase, partial [Chlorobi bacterium]|nr:TAT-variant-translocated molybdopterin oxidoreductase [Chlorobiota bacterium]
MKQKKYWKTISENTSHSQNGKNRHPEFGEWVENTIFKKQLSRRDFLKWTGLTTAATTLASCWEVPVRKAIPYFIQPEESIPGVSVHYATAYFDGEEFASLLVKTREGRPIKVDPHPKAPFNATSAKIQGSLFNLYDHRRLNSPLHKGEKTSWEKALKETKAILDSVKEGGKVRLVTPTIISPATKKLIDEFLPSFADAKHIQYDVVSFAALLDAHKKAFGKRVVPDYRIDKAKIVLGVEADFLGGWLSAGEMARRYGVARRVSKDSPAMLLHLQAETRYSLTGSNADYRYKLKVGEHLPFIIGLYNTIAKKTDSGLPTFPVSLSQDLERHIAEVSEKLLSTPGYALVLYGPNDLKGQMFTLAINHLLGAYDSGLADVEKPLYIRQGCDQQFFELIDEMNKGDIDVLIIYDVNPVYDYAYPMVFSEALKKVKHVITLAEKNHETAQLGEWILPSTVPYESWRDYLPKEGVYFIAQPVFTGLYNAKQFEDVLLTWLGKEQNFYSYLKSFWTENIYPLYGTDKEAESLWQQTIHDGFFLLKNSSGQPVEKVEQTEEPVDLTQYVTEASQVESVEVSAPAIYLYEPIIGTGRYSNNAWLQETPE